MPSGCNLNSMPKSGKTLTQLWPQNLEGGLHSFSAELFIGAASEAANYVTHPCSLRD